MKFILRLFEVIMRCFASILLVVFSITFVLAQSNSDTKVDRAQKQIDDLIRLIQSKDQSQFQWNRYETVSFEVFSIDDVQGRQISNNVEFIKFWIFWRWGMKDIEWSNKCKIMVVPTRELFVKIFAKDKSSCKYDSKGSAIWICTEDARWATDVLPKLMTEVSLKEFEAKFNTKFGFWAHRGMAVLNGNLVELKTTLSFSGDFILSKVMLTMTPEQYIKLSEPNRLKFDSQCAAFCLMLRKEYGLSKFLDYLGQSRNDPENSLGLFNFNNYAVVDNVLFNYIENLSKDIRQQRTPNSYLSW